MDIRLREQLKNRPGLVLTERNFNQATGLVMACPVTWTERPYGSRVALAGTTTKGYVMVVQVKSVDWQTHGVAFIEVAPLPVLDHVRQILAAILDMAR
jgi:mRNA interferase MazF